MKKGNWLVKITPIGEILIDILFLLLGSILLIIPTTSSSTISVVLGLIIVFYGTFYLFRGMVCNKKKININKYDEPYGVVTIITGLYIILNGYIFNININYLFAIFVQYNAVYKIGLSLLLQNKKKSISKLLMSSAIITALFGSIIMFNPFSGTMLIAEMIGTFLVLYVIMDIMVSQLVFKETRKIK